LLFSYSLFDLGKDCIPNSVIVRHGTLDALFHKLSTVLKNEAATTVSALAAFAGRQK
jgi:hypothetical protein